MSGDSVTFGFNVASSGAYSTAGKQELRGFKLAVKHINNGGGWVTSEQYESPLDGDGLLDKDVEFAVEDTGGNSETARSNAQRLVDSEEVIMLAGGTSSNSGLANQEVAAQNQVVYMATMANANSLTGIDCNRYSFREMYNNHMAAKALAPALSNEFGDDVNYVKISQDNEWGQTLRDEMDTALGNLGWAPVWDTTAQVGTTDYSQYAEDIKSVDFDVIVLGLGGLDAVNALRAFREEFPESNIVLPIASKDIARTAGDAIEGVIGTVAWSPAINSPLSDTFRESFREEYGSSTGTSKSASPSGAAHIAYTQTLQYASAAERVGTFNPIDVIGALEGHEYDAGLGPQTLRACDHQAMRQVPVVKGKPEVQQSYGTYYGLIGEPADVQYACDSGPAANCSLGGN
ncbi:ABC transporter substrate-binding protein [Haloarcula hispanica]|uniref:ABC transporter substrate-binding protein n=1 Tax=Haloarcula hispanica TaxID=51589 RepID=A0A482T8Q6_HALHI|nr:ABC transporter substrate-binding protein [Haloarcula hispanica]KAA9407392.1 ABC transporter substrate-binding protein [Haloarcula sp. CBA1131]KZX48355.1 ABC transporter leucine-binding protein [Haloarcula sp. K1]MCJ0618608.1 ABC transporter substrate-binding protein [Haloarcula hispanica]RYJ11490.1 ABC transporter substrate-binding protein [Haloarcula hispanica]